MIGIYIKNTRNEKKWNISVQGFQGDMLPWEALISFLTKFAFHFFISIFSFSFRKFLSFFVAIGFEWSQEAIIMTTERDLRGFVKEIPQHT